MWWSQSQSLYKKSPCPWNVYVKRRYIDNKERNKTSEYTVFPAVTSTSRKNKWHVRWRVLGWCCLYREAKKPHQLGDIWVEPEENEEVSTATISARSESPEQGGCLACSMRYREMPVDRAQWTIRGLLAVRSERYIGWVLRAMARTWTFTLSVMGNFRRHRELTAQK